MKNMEKTIIAMFENKNETIGWAEEHRKTGEYSYMPPQDHDNYRDPNTATYVTQIGKVFVEFLYGKDATGWPLYSEIFAIKKMTEYDDESSEVELFDNSVIKFKNHNTMTEFVYCT